VVELSSGVTFVLEASPGSAIVLNSVVAIRQTPGSSRTELSVLTADGGFLGEGGAVVWSLLELWAGTLTVSASRLEWNTAGDSGGALAVMDSSRSELISCVLVENTALQLFGGIGAFSQAGVNITGSMLIRNWAWSGGGVGVTGNARMRISDSVLARNHASSCGGAALVVSTTPLFISGAVTFNSNIADGNGGAVCLLADRQSGGCRQGALFTSTYSSSEPSSSMVFSNNTAVGGGGGAIFNGCWDYGKEIPVIFSASSFGNEKLNISAQIVRTVLPQLSQWQITDNKAQYGSKLATGIREVLVIARGQHRFYPGDKINIVMAMTDE
jgi:predicted outer membrane repeat protein